MHIPPPPRWNKAVDGLDLEESVRQAQEFERSFLPRGIAFPREGQIWRTTRDCQVSFLAGFTQKAFEEIRQGIATPNRPLFFPFGPAQIGRGEPVRILAVDNPRPLRVCFVPVRYAELEEGIVPEYIRSNPGYTHYQLSATTARTFGLEKGLDYFIDCFELIQDTSTAT
jgi:hypothetical protein